MLPLSIADNKVAAVAIGSLSFLSVLYVYRNTRPSAALPPGPPPSPVVGNVFQMPKERPWLKYAEWANQYGDIVHVRAFNQHMIILSNYEDATKLMHDTRYSGRLQTVMLHDLMGFGWGVTPLPYGPDWRLCRKLLHEQFNRHEVKHYAAQQEASTRVMLRGLLNAPENFPTHVQWWSIQIVVDISYGIDIGDDDSYVTLAKQVSRYFALGVEPFRWLVDIFPFLKYVPDWMPGAHFKQVAKDARAISQKFLDEPYAEVEKRVAAGTARRSFVSNLIAQLDKSNPTHKRTEWAIKDTAAVFYAAGAETTSATVETAILYMVLYPEVVTKAQTELDTVTGKNRLPALGDRPDLPYVTAFLMEVMRCSPVVPLGIPHLLTETDHYKGYMFPNGSLVLPNSREMLRDSRVYVDPDDFNPDRFLATEDRAPEVDPSDVGVFGFGRRKCPGQYIAESSAWLAVASILAAFDVSPALDDVGKPIDVHYALSGITDLVSRPLRFPCSIKARSEQAISLISAT